MYAIFSSVLLLTSGQTQICIYLLFICSDRCSRDRIVLEFIYITYEIRAYRNQRLLFRFPLVVECIRYNNYVIMFVSVIRLHPPTQTYITEKYVF